jgi:hypothetical protein
MIEAIMPPDDGVKRRCPRLGHQIAFSYCRRENSGLPCFKTLDCWFEYFQVDVFLKDALSADEWQKAFERPPKPKMLSLVELIEQAQKGNRKE